MSEAINDGGPVNPTNGPDHGVYGAGMSLRDYFAAKAMLARTSDYQSCQSLARVADSRGVSFANELAAQSYDMADAMIRARGGSAA